MSRTPAIDMVVLKIAAEGCTMMLCAGSVPPRSLIMLPPVVCMLGTGTPR